MAQSYNSRVTGLPVQTVDDNGNTVQAGSATIAGGIVLGKSAAPPLPLGSVALYSPDGVSVQAVGNDGGAIGLAPGSISASVQGLIAWDYDSELAGSTGLLVSGTVNLSKIVLTSSATVSNVLIAVTTGGGTLTAGQNLVGIYNMAGQRLAVSVDQTAAWATTGTKIAALTAPVALIEGTYYVAVLSVGTTPITVAESPGFQSTYNANLAAATFRHAAGPTGQTALPASITMASNTSSAQSIWCALT